MFKKKKNKVKAVPSFPFMEQTTENFKMAYDSMEVEVKDKYVKITFIQNDVPIYAYTFDKEDNDILCTVQGMKGEVEINLTNG